MEVGVKGQFLLYHRVWRGCLAQDMLLVVIILHLDKLYIVA